MNQEETKKKSKKNLPKKPTSKSRKKNPPRFEIEYLGDLENIFRITIYEERPISLNRLWAGVHWRTRSAEKNRIHNLFESIMSSLESFSVIEEKVDIDFTCYMSNKGRARLYDSDNVVIKPYIDGLRDFLLTDDTTKYVGRVSIEVVNDNDNPRLEILLKRRKNDSF